MLYAFGWYLFRALLWFFGRFRVEGEENVPAEGGVILACNHVSYLDPPAVGAAIHRPTWYMAKQELFEVPLFGWVISRTRAFPVRRGAPDRRALRRATELLAAGEVVTMFPEGGRRDGDRLEDPELGLAFIAARSGAPVVPVALMGTEQVLPRGAKFPHFGRVVVRFGEPLSFSQYGGRRASKQELQEISQEVMAAIGGLMGTCPQDAPSRSG
ncbi:MAG: lysophospholipid acyltransferase family protein [Armatimonadota bacterium]